MEMQDIGLMIFGERFEDTRLYLCQKYWELKGMPGYNKVIKDEILKLHDLNLSPIPYLTEMLKQYPDAPDIMELLIHYIRGQRNFILAYKISGKLISLYPHKKYIHTHKFIEIMVKWELSTEQETTNECMKELTEWNEAQKSVR